jgi:hypothetical protein
MGGKKDHEKKKENRLLISDCLDIRCDSWGGGNDVWHIPKFSSSVQEQKLVG